MARLVNRLVRTHTHAYSYAARLVNRLVGSIERETRDKEKGQISGKGEHAILLRENGTYGEYTPFLSVMTLKLVERAPLVPKYHPTYTHTHTS